MSDSEQTKEELLAASVNLLETRSYKSSCYCFSCGELHYNASILICSECLVDECDVFYKKAVEDIESDISKTWIDEQGYERGLCLCEMEPSTHPDDSYGGLDFCPNCNQVTCADCREELSQYCKNCSVEPEYE